MWGLLLITLVVILVFKPTRAIVARDPILFVSLFICAIPGVFLGDLLFEGGGRTVRGAWWAKPLGVVITTTAIGPGLAEWLKDLFGGD